MKNQMAVETIAYPNNAEALPETLLSSDHDQAETTENPAHDPLYVLSDESWRKVDPHIKKIQRTLHKENPNEKGVDISQDGYRNILRGIYFHLRGNSKWHEIPVEYGEYISIHRHFRNWLKAGLFDKVDRLVRKEEKKNWNMFLKKIKAETSERPESSDFQVATETINSFSYALKRQTGKIPLRFDYLMDDEQLAAIASFERVLCNFADILKRLEKNKCSEKLSAQNSDHAFAFSNPLKYVDNIVFYIELCLGKLASVYANLSDEERSVVCKMLTGEWERLNALLSELKEIERMNIHNAETLQ